MWGEIDGMTNIPEAAKFAWGARAIKEKPDFSLLHDRMGFRFIVDGKPVSIRPDNQKKEHNKFENWLSKKAFVAARRWASYVSSSSSDIFTCDSDDGYHFRATCNASYGYIYMTAWAD